MKHININIKINLFFLILLFSNVLMGAEYLSEEDFSWNQSLEEMIQNSKILYRSPKRLIDRAYRTQSGEIIIPVRIGDITKPVRVSKLFIQSITKHIELALKRNYVDVITFSDMGHSHFFIPQKYYDDVVNQIPVEDKHIIYEKILNHPKLKILYHTAEQLMMLDENQELLKDRHIQWRFFTRNLIGDNEGLGQLELLHNKTHRYNTAHDYDDGYRYWGGGFYISAHQDGLFPFRVNGEIRYFDINLEGINPKKNF
jgi:hypothetical protein